MARPTPDISALVNGQEAWDAVLRDILSAVLDNPFPPAEYANFAALPAAGSYDRCFAVTLDTDILYFSSSASWTAVGGAPGVPGWVWVSTKSDLPAPSGGVITLTDSYTYMFLDEVDLTGDRLVLGTNTVLNGSSSENARIKSTGLTGTALITSSTSCPMRDLSIEADVALDLTALTPDQNITWEGVNFIDCPTIGTIEDYENVLFTGCAALNSANLTFDGTIATIAFDGSIFDARSGQASILLASTLEVTRRFRVIYSAFIVSSGETGIDVDGSAVIPVEGYILDTVNFSGGGTYTSGVAYDDNKSLWTNNKGITNSASIASFSMVGNATETVITVDTPTAILGTTIEGSINQRFTHASNSLTYDGTINRAFRITASLSLSGGNNKDLTLTLYKNGSEIPGSSMPVTTSGTGNLQSVIIQTITELVNNDEVEVWVENTSDSSNVTVSSMNAIVEALN